MKKYIAEAIGTFALVFCGTGAIIIHQQTDSIGHAGIAITFGLIVMAMIFAFGHISGAHINPAVSIGFVLTKHFQKKDLIPYIVFQMIGAILASSILKWLFPLSKTMGETLPAGSAMQSFVLEIILTYLLMLVILLVGQNTKGVSAFTAIAVGGTVGLEAMFAGPITGASMNPARSLAPALVSGEFNHLWVYLIAPVIGAVLATFTWHLLKEE